MTVSSDLFTAQERIESLKAGVLTGAIAIGPALGFPLLSKVVSGVDYGLALLPNAADTVPLVFAVVSSALFGITYRYVVRQDHNPQLAAGVVGAFGLVRGLAQIETGIGGAAGWVLALKLGESMALFAIAQFGLQIALQRRWLQPFGAAPRP